MIDKLTPEHMQNPVFALRQAQNLTRLDLGFKAALSCALITAFEIGRPGQMSERTAARIAAATSTDAQKLRADYDTWKSLQKPRRRTHAN